jgi:hypothetical protein
MLIKEVGEEERRGERHMGGRDCERPIQWASYISKSWTIVLAPPAWGAGAKRRSGERAERSVTTIGHVRGRGRGRGREKKEGNIQISNIRISTIRIFKFKSYSVAIPPIKNTLGGWDLLLPQPPRVRVRFYHSIVYIHINYVAIS